MNTKDGGPAFPSGSMSIGDGDVVAYVSGMSIRDWFAGQTMRSLLGGAVQMNINDHQASEYARFAFMVADAMLKARESSND